MRRVEKHEEGWETGEGFKNRREDEKHEEGWESEERLRNWRKVSKLKGHKGKKEKEVKNKC